MVLHGSWEPQGTFSKMECYKMRQTSVPETPKEETTLVSLQAKFKNSWIWPHNTETENFWTPICERFTNTQTLEWIIIKKLLDNFFLNNKHFQNTQCTRKGILKTLSQCASFIPEPRCGMGWCNKALAWGLNLKGNIWYRDSTLPDSTKGMFLIQDWRIIQF